MGSDRFLAERHSPADELWREKEDRSSEYFGRLRQLIEASEQASTTMDRAVAVRLKPTILRRKIAGFMEFVHDVYALGGWQGSIRFELRLVSPDAFPAVSAPKRPGSTASEMIDFLHLSETKTLQATAEFQYEALETRRDDLVEDTMGRIAHHFGMDKFPI